MPVTRAVLLTKEVPEVDDVGTWLFPLEALASISTMQTLVKMKGKLLRVICFGDRE